MLFTCDKYGDDNGLHQGVNQQRGVDTLHIGLRGTARGGVMGGEAEGGQHGKTDVVRELWATPIRTGCRTKSGQLMCCING